jgi:hypothetical protein
MAMANVVAYSDELPITAIKSFIVHAPDWSLLPRDRERCLRVSSGLSNTTFNYSDLSRHIKLVCLSL